MLLLELPQLLPSIQADRNPRPLRPFQTRTTSISTASSPVPVPSRPESILRSAVISPVDPTGLFQYGFPGPVADLRPAASLTSSYDRRLRNPAWVAEHITPESLAARGGDRKNSVFHEDSAIPEKFRAKLRDYFRSGYDRGHQVPAADAKWSQEAMDATFALSNMWPAGWRRVQPGLLGTL